MIIKFIEEHYVAIIVVSVLVIIFFVVRHWVINAPTIDDKHPENKL